MVYAALILVVSLFGSSPLFADGGPLGDPIDEGSTSRPTIRITDSTRAAVTPAEILAWVDDVSTTARLHGVVSITPASVVTLTLPPAANRIVDNNKDLEEHVLTLQVKFPSGCTSACEWKQKEFRYLVRNLRVVVGGGSLQPSPAPTPTNTP